MRFPNLMVLLASWALGGCVDEGATGRSAWLRQTLITDNRPLLERSTAPVAGKFAKMGQTPYAFFRGTQPRYLRDQTQPSALYSHRVRRHGPIS